MKAWAQTTPDLARIYGLATSTTPTLSFLLVQSAGLRGCLPHASSPQTSVRTRLPGLWPSSTPGSNCSWTESPGPSNLRLTHWVRTAGYTAQLSLPTKKCRAPRGATATHRGASLALPRVPMAAARCLPGVVSPGAAGPARRGVAHPSAAAGPCSLAPATLGARRADPGAPQAQSLCERAPCARSRATARAHTHSLSHQPPDRR